MLIDIIVSVILIAVIGGAIAYIVRAKKRGATCVGCPCAKECAMRKMNCSCNSNNRVGDGRQVDQSK